MTLNEKLNLISDLENEKLSSELIESIIEDLEHPEPVQQRFSTVKDLLSDLYDNNIDESMYDFDDSEDFEDDFSDKD